MSILNEQAFKIDIIKVSFYPFGHEKPRRNKQLEKGPILCKYKDQMEWLQSPANWLHPPTDWLNCTGRQVCFMLACVFKMSNNKMHIYCNLLVQNGSCLSIFIIL